MSFVAARVDAQAARAFFTRPRWGNLFGVMRPRERVTPSGKALPRLELVWLGCYKIDVRVRAGKVAEVTSVSVEGQSGAFAIFAMHSVLVEGEPPEPHFPPQVTAEQAVRLGRQELLRSILRRRSRQVKPVIEDTVGVAIFYYPHWVWYFARRNGRIDVAMQDAYTGKPTGGRTRAGLLTAFVRAHRERNHL